MNIALLARVSTQEQAVNGHSIDEQIDRMRDYCKAMNWTVYKEYVDAGFSGANTDRPALQRMIRDIKKGKIDKVLVYKLDRLSRSQKDTLELIEDVFLASNTDFVSMSENFDTSTPFGRAMIGILAVFAQLEREQIKERMTMGRMARAKMGKYHGASSPIGYDYIDGELVINEFEKMQVEQIFDMYAQGKSPQKIADDLNEAGLSHKDGKWIPSTVREVLDKKVYIGYVKYCGQYYQGTHLPFIDQELFNKVQEIRQRKREEHELLNRRLGKANSYLGGYLECACCHGKYNKHTARRTVQGKKYEYFYYQCNSRSKKHKKMIKDPKCMNKNWRMEALDDLVFSEIKKLATDPQYIVQLKDEKPEDERPTIINEKIKSLDEQLSRLMDLYAMGGLSVDIMQDKIHALNDQKMKLEHELEEIERGNQEKMSHEETMRIVNSFKAILERNDFDEIRAVIGELIEKIEVDGDDITIRWNFV